LILDRNLAFAHGYLGLAKYFTGRGEDTEAHVREYLRLSPFDTWACTWMVVVGISKIALGKDGEAVAWLQPAIEANRTYPLAYFSLAAALANLGRIEDAHAALRAGFAFEPRATVSRVRHGASSSNPIYLAGRERIIEGIRKAGMPEE
jgi:Flp pilus assembly protein TadD